MNAASTPPLIDVRELAVHFRPHDRSPAIRALDDVSLQMERGAVYGIVGESGSGKSTLGRVVVGLQRPTEGSLRIDGEDLCGFGDRQMKRFRQRIQMVPQDAAASLSPRFTVRQLIEEALVIRGVPRDRWRPTSHYLAMVELGAEHGDKYPHELSGGQARRIGIARALAMEPEFIVADEITAGLDVSAVASVVNLVARLRTELGLGYLFISHDLDVVAYLADVMAVMYLGEVVETGPATQLASAPRHPYTLGLLTARNHQGQSVSRNWRIRGDLPSAYEPPGGCRFHPRCSFARPVCAQSRPKREPCGPNGHIVACHFWQDIAAETDAARHNTHHEKEREKP